MNQNEYVNILQNVMLPYENENMPLKQTYQQDNDPTHSSCKAKQCFEDEKRYLLPLPSQSPDLNHIENLWNNLKIAVGRYKINSKAVLWELVQKEYIESLSFPQ